MVGLLRFGNFSPRLRRSVALPTIAGLFQFGLFSLAAQPTTRSANCRR